MPENQAADAAPEASIAMSMELEKGSVDGISHQVQVTLTPSSEDQVDEEDLDPDWVAKIKRKHRLQPRRLKGSSIVKSCSIHRVPHRLRQQDDKAYVPHVISIGPFHHDKRKDQLRAMEEQKWRYLHEFLARNGEVCLEIYLKAVKKLEKDARACYSEEIDLDSNDFVEMMVLDGCFLIELFRRKCNNQSLTDDPLLELNWLRTSVTCDLLMLENQIPFFVLEKLFDLMKIPGGASLVDIIFGFFRFPVRQHKTPVQHILHLLHSSGPLPKINSNPKSSSIQMIKCASKLKEAGIEFKNADQGEFWDIKFRNGVLEIPTWEISDHDNTSLLNFVAYEQCYLFCCSHYTAYTTFMDCLINSVEDVEILSGKGIIKSWMGSSEDVVALFNKSGRDVTIYPNNFYLRDVFDDINQYCVKDWPRLRATYFKNPWAIISFVVAAYALFLASTQSFFSAFPSFAHK